MAKKRRAKPRPLVLPAHLIPDPDKFGTPAEERKTALRNQWLDEHDLTYEYFFEWAPAFLRERERLAGLPPSPPARRKGPLPENVRKLLAELEHVHDTSGEQSSD